MARKFPAARPKKNKIINVDIGKCEEGYDSDGNLPFYFNYEEDDIEEANIDEIDELDNDAPSSASPPVSISDEVLSKMGVSILKEEVKK